MKKLLGFFVVMLCLLGSFTAGAEGVSAEECAHEKYSEVHISGSQYLICDDCGATVKELGTNACIYDDLDLDGFCDICGCDVRFLVYGDGTFYESMEEAAAAMRVILQKRDRISHVFFEVTEEEYNDSDLSFKFGDIVFRHTGVFNEGDYLAYSFIMNGYGPDHIRYGDRYYIGQYMHQFPCATTGEQEAALYAKIGEIIEENGWEELKGYDRIKAVYDWVCENVSYDHEHFAVCDGFYHLQDLATPIQTDFLPHSAYNAIFEGKSVCQGYAQLMYLFYNKLGVDCRYVSGSAGGPHAWNIVELDGLYYFIDATWDSQLRQAGQEYEYFLRSKSNMKDHFTEDEVLDGYNLAENDYGYVPGDEDAIVESGKINSVEWCLTGGGTLILSGTGKILENPVSNKILIKKIVIGDGIEEIGTIDYERWRGGNSYAVFANCSNLKSVEIGSGLTIIGDETFRHCELLTEITIPDQVMDIGYQAFYGCKTLKSVSLPKNFKTIHIGLFTACYELTDIKIPDSVTVIEGNAFDYCTALVSIELPKDLEELGAATFGYCSSLKEITIPDGIKTLEFSMFSYCTSLTSVTLPAEIEVLQQTIFTGCTSLTEINLPNTIKSIGHHCFSQTAFKTIDLPDGLTEISDHLLGACQYLESIEIPSNVTKIGMYAFSSCDALTEIRIPDGVTEIGKCAFANCDNLQAVTLPAALNELGYGCFSSCKSLKNIVIPGKGVSVGEWAFYQCSALESVEFLEQEETISIGKEAFCYCTNMTSVIFPESPISVGERAFSKCSSLESVDLPVKLLSIDNGGFSGCSSLVSIVLSESLTYIAPNTFQDCSSLTDITFSESLTSIGDRAFYNCASLTAVTLPESVTSIGAGAFDSCSKLMTVTLPNNLTFLGESVFSYPFNANNSGILFCKAGSSTAALISQYNYPFVDPEYSDLRIAQISDNQGNAGIKILKYLGSSNDFVLPEEIGAQPIKEILWGAFSGYVTLYCNAGSSPAAALADIGRKFIDSAYPDYGIKQVLRADGGWNISIEAYVGNDAVISVPTEIRSMPVTAIGYSAFYGCDILEKIVLPESVTEIGNMAFYNCSNLEEINLPEGITKIGSSAFYSCSKLTEIILPENITQIGSSTFGYCSGLTNINIPEQVTSIGDLAFFCCSKLTEINLPANVTKIGSRAFERCSGLTSINIPSSVTNIGSQAFDECTGLTAVSVQGDGVVIGSSAFINCKKLKEVSFMGEDVSIGEKAFNSSRELHLTFMGNTAPVLHENGVFAAGGAVTVSCYEGSGVAQWALDSGYTVVYLEAEAEPSVEQIILPTEYRAEVGDEFAMEYQVLPEMESPVLVWASSDERVARVDQNGMVCVILPGTAVISVTADNGVSAGCSVIVRELQSLTLPEALTEVESEAFMGIGAEQIVLPEGCTTIGSRGFADCAALKLVYWPDGAVSIAENAFEGCENVIFICAPDHAAAEYAQAHGFRWYDIESGD